MSLSVKAVKSLLSRARVNLKTLLQPYIDDGTMPKRFLPKEDGDEGESSSSRSKTRSDGMKNAASQLTEADDELLTSYLDQELSPEERGSFERRLVDDEPLRKRLAEMRRAWDLLDELPETPFTPNFTQSTLEMVAIDLEKEKERAQPIIGLRMPAWVSSMVEENTGRRVDCFGDLGWRIGRFCDP